MDEPAPRTWLRFHLSTLLVLQPVAAMAIWLNCRPPVILNRTDQNIVFLYSGWPLAAVGVRDTESGENAANVARRLARETYFNSPDTNLNIGFAVTLLFCTVVWCELWVRRRTVRIGSTAKLVMGMMALFLLVYNIFPCRCRLASFAQEPEYFLQGAGHSLQVVRAYGMPFFTSGDLVNLGLSPAPVVWHKNLAVALVLLTLAGLICEYSVRAFLAFSARYGGIRDESDKGQL